MFSEPSAVSLGAGPTDGAPKERNRNLTVSFGYMF